MSAVFGSVVLDISGVDIDAVDRELLCHPQTGGVILFSRNYEDPRQLRELVRAIRDCRTNLVIAVDQEGGRVQRFRTGFTRLPPLHQLDTVYAADSDLAKRLATELGWLMASEVIAVDVDLSFAPVLDVFHACSRVIGDRAFSADIEPLVALASAYIDGMNAAGMQATGKHFPGHGGVVADSHVELPVDTRDLAHIRALDMQPFMRLQSKLSALMPAHVLFPAVDDKPCGYSAVWLHDILRTELAYQGLIFSDDLSMEAAAFAGDYCSRADLALAAGCSSVLVCNNRPQAELVVEHLEARGYRTDARYDLAKMAHRGTIQSPQDLHAQQRWKRAQDLLQHMT